MNVFQSNIINMYGKKGKEWVNELPELVSAISSKHGLRYLKEVANLTDSVHRTVSPHFNALFSNKLESRSRAEKLLAHNCA